MRFEDVAGSSGLASFRHVGGSTSDKRYIPEVMSGGVCAFDLDEDGWTDILLVNGGTFEALAGKAPPPPHALFRNRGDGTFDDITARSGIRNAGWGMGCATADYDNDGRTDVYITYFKTQNQLWRNLGGGRFEDVTARSGAGGPPGHWSTGATFGDYDRDGRLDLFVAGYVSLDPAKLPEPAEKKDCRHRGLVVNCGPRGLAGEGDLLFHNEGDGTFREVGAAVGVSDPQKHYGLGAVFLPGAPEEPPALFVANDSTPNAWYRFTNGRFQDEALETGLALSEEGHEQACMGIAWGDYDADGRLDIHVTNFVDDYNTLYRALPGGQFEDASRRARLVQPTWLMMGWGTAFGDFDLDGRPDLVVANGHVYPSVDSLNLPSKYRMPVQAFRNRGDGTFSELPRTDLAGEAVGRGLAVADFWNDGRIGFVINNLDGTPAFYRNRTATGGRFLEIRLEGSPSNRSAVGARVDATWSGGRSMQVVASGGSYLSSHDPRVHLGLGIAAAVDLRVSWPSGRVQEFRAVATNRAYHLREGGTLR